MSDTGITPLDTRAIDDERDRARRAYRRDVQLLVAAAAVLAATLLGALMVMGGTDQDGRHDVGTSTDGRHDGRHAAAGELEIPANVARALKLTTCLDDIPVTIALGADGSTRDIYGDQNRDGIITGDECATE